MRRSVTVATKTLIGPRHENQDRAFAVLADDGGWLIAVADGLGGHPRGAEAAQVAVDCLAEPVGSEPEMAELFKTASDAVCELFEGRRSFGNISRMPMSTLVVVSAAGGQGQTPLVGWLGDTLPFKLSVEDQVVYAEWLGAPHRDESFVGRCLGFGRSDPEMVYLDTDTANGIALLSDGAWERLVGPSGYFNEDRFQLDLDCEWEAEQIADLILRRAEANGLEDNATVAVACW